VHLKQTSFYGSHLPFHFNAHDVFQPLDLCTPPLTAHGSLSAAF
jgi:hypothetical protein